MRSGDILYWGKGFLSIPLNLLILCPAMWIMGVDSGGKKSYRHTLAFRNSTLVREVRYL